MDALERRDMEAMLAQMAPDIVYHNIPLDPVGKDGARVFLTNLFENIISYRVDVSSEGGSGSVVFNERIEYFVFSNDENKTIEIPVAGVFEINDAGLITGWRDYFDSETWVSQGGPALDLGESLVYRHKRVSAYSRGCVAPQTKGGATEAYGA